MRKIFAVLIFMIPSLSSCKTYHQSPSIRFQNSSLDGREIKNIQITWSGHKLLKISRIKDVCNGINEQTFTMNKRSDIFGPVHAEWENSNGKKISRDFIFKKDDFASFANNEKHNSKHYPYIILFFTQDNLEYYTSDNPNIENIERAKKGSWAIKWFEKEWAHKCVNDPEEVKRNRDLYKKYPIIDKRTGKAVEM